MSETIKELRELSDEEIIYRHDKKAKNTVVGTKHYLGELERRSQERQTEALLKYTKWMFWFTVAVTSFTVVNVVLFVIDIFLL